MQVRQVAAQPPYTLTLHHDSYFQSVAQKKKKMCELSQQKYWALTHQDATAS